MYDKSGFLSCDEHMRGENMRRCTKYIASHEVSASGVPYILRMTQYRRLFALDEPQPIQGEKPTEGVIVLEDKRRRIVASRSFR